MQSAGHALVSGVRPDFVTGRIGPNAVIQLAEALRPYPGLARRVFARAGLSYMLNALPEAMIDQAIPARLFATLWHEVSSDLANCVAYEAGRLTGNYVLVNRIPRLACMVLRALPPRLASALLLKAIHKHAWTFAGTGECHVQDGTYAAITIVENPMRMPGGVWHIGVFESLFRALVNPLTEVSHTERAQDGALASCFQINYRKCPNGRKDKTS